MTETRWGAGLAEAAKLHEAGRPAEAEERLRRLLRDTAAGGRARPVPVLVRLAGVLLDRREGERAYAVADEAVSLEPRNPLALNLRASALGVVGRRTEAEEGFRKALALDPAF